MLPYKMKYFLCFLFLFFLSFSYAQNTRKMDRLLTLLKTEKKDSSKVNCLNELSIEYRNISSYDTALYYAADALQCAQRTVPITIGIKRGISKAHNCIGNIYLEQTDYPKALDHYFKALKIDQELNDKSGMAKRFGNIGIIYDKQSDYTKALSYYFKALSLYEEAGNKRSMELLLGNIGIIYSEQADYPKALSYCFMAIKMSEKMGNKTGITSALHTIGVVYYEQKKYTLALDYWHKSLQIGEQLGDKSNIAANLGDIGNLYIFLSKYNDSYTCLYRSLAIADSIGAMNTVKECYRYLSALYETSTIPLRDTLGGKFLSMEQMPRRALYYYKRSISVRDSLFSEKNKKQLMLTEMNYELEKKETAARAEREKEELLAATDAQRKKIIISGTIILLIAIGILLLILQRLRYKKDKIIFEKEKILLESELMNSQKLLDNYMENLLQKSRLLEQFEVEIEKLKNLKAKELYEKKIEYLDQLNKSIILTDEDWNKFKELFEQVYKGFLVRLKEKYPDLTPAEVRLMCLTKLKLDTRQMAAILGVSDITIKKTRQRVRKKINITEEESIDSFVISL